MIRFSHILATAAVVVVFCADAAVAAKPRDEVEQVTTTLPTLNPGQTAWVSTLWRGASTDATSFELIATEPNGISISYPENTGSYSSLYKQSTLLADDTDYASRRCTRRCTSVARLRTEQQLHPTYTPHDARRTAHLAAVRAG